MSYFLPSQADLFSSNQLLEIIFLEAYLLKIFDTIIDNSLSFNHMVESIGLNLIFGALADATRRDILKRVSREERTISELAEHYAMSFAAIAKHVSVLEKARLVTKRQKGKQKIVRISPETVKVATAHLSEYEKVWGARFDALEKLLEDK